MVDSQKPNIISVNGVVAVRNGEPYVQLSTTKHGVIVQLAVAEARSLAMDLLSMAFRTEADAMVHAFVQQELEQPPNVSSAMMKMFRDFRVRQDGMEVETSVSEPFASEPLPDPPGPIDGNNRMGGK